MLLQMKDTRVVQSVLVVVRAYVNSASTKHASRAPRKLSVSLCMCVRVRARAYVRVTLGLF